MKRFFGFMWTFIVVKITIGCVHNVGSVGQIGASSYGPAWKFIFNNSTDGEYRRRRESKLYGSSYSISWDYSFFRGFS